MQQDNPLQQQRLENSFGERCLMDSKHQQCALETVNTHCVLAHITKSIENRQTEVILLKYSVLCLSAISQMLFWAPPCARVSN